MNFFKWAVNSVIDITPGSVGDFNFNKETDMSEAIVAINARNQFKGKIKEIIPGVVVSEVNVETAAGIVTSVVTSRSIANLNLRIGTEVLMVFKSTEVLLAKL